ncbi:4-galactosyl-N-acetylglucosaminide 3-alpha-L-fucosyltransferase 9-like [Hoplias malabaricus]|uniref:4-galactosyl-N-acetylglucosaminide 3-alpha-L-fucosyltransferase 9-like n=1 Tax=Hoplias malabaricus TaxID=27720 RepID=UPI003462FC7B
MASDPGHSFLRLLRYVILVVAILLMGSLYYSPSFRCLTQQLSPVHSVPRHILVLVWFWPFNMTFDLDSCRSQFNIEGCLLTVDRQLYNKADAVLIHHRDISWDLSNLPRSPRPPHQKWIWMNAESPSNTEQIPGLDKMFNISLNYRRDADIRVPYGWMTPIEKNLEDFELPKKNKIVCWVVSNYQHQHRRVHYYRELTKYIRVHVYGEYFNKPLSEKEYKQTISSCKFYLAFENSVHKDYITEKLFNALVLGAVPVVFGPSRQNYERFVSSDAFIHAEDFPSVRALAKYLFLLHENEAPYRRYFTWRRRFEAQTSSFPAEHACRSCEYIRRNRQYQVLTNLYRWYWDGDIRQDMSLSFY